MLSPLNQIYPMAKGFICNLRHGNVHTVRAQAFLRSRAEGPYHSFKHGLHTPSQQGKPMKFTTFLFAAPLLGRPWQHPWNWKPANPQPGSLQVGLGVSDAPISSVPKIRSLSAAELQLKNKKPGKPLSVS